MRKRKSPMRLRREELKLSRREMAERMGVSAVAINKWEDGDKNPGIDSYIKLACFFRVDIMVLKDEHDDWRADNGTI